MTLLVQDIGRDATGQAITALLDASGGGSFDIFTTAFGTLLASCALESTAYGTFAAGSGALQGTPADASADDTGTAAVYRALDGASTVIWDGPVAVTGGGGGDINLPVATRNAGLEALTDLLDSGNVQFATDDTFGSVLLQVTLNATAFADAASGAIALDATGLSGSTTGAGTITAFRFRTSANAEVMRGTCAISGSDWNWDNNVVASAQPVVLNNQTFTMPATIASSDGALQINNLSIAATQSVTVTSGSYNQPAQLV